MPTFTINFTTFHLNDLLNGWRRRIRNAFQEASRIFSGPAFGSQPIRLVQGPISAESVYCVPGVYNPTLTTAATTVSSAFFSNVGSNEGIFLNANMEADTLAHELVHLLTGHSHCASPDTHWNRACQCATTNNLMYHTGVDRTDTELTEEQVSVIRRNGTRYIN